MSIEIYHNPRCTKCRQTLALIEERGQVPQVIEYLKTPPDAQTLQNLLDMLGLQPSELVRHFEAPFKELGLDAADTTEEQIFAAMLSHPILIQRPIVVNNGRAAIGRPPHTVLEIL